MTRLMRLRARSSWRLVVLLTAILLVGAGPGRLGAQGTPGNAGAEAPNAGPPVSFTVLAGQVARLFPAIETQVVEAAGPRVTLAAGRSAGVQPGLELTAFRPGRELFHPTTKASLGRTEETLGRLTVTEVFENYSIATPIGSVVPLKPGDAARLSSGKLRLTVLPLSSGPRTKVAEQAAYELIQELERTGRFQVAFGDQIGLWLAQQRITPEQLLTGAPVRKVSEQFKISHLLAVHFTTAQGKPFMDVRLFSSAVDAPLLQTALFVPSSVKPRVAQEFSSGPGSPMKAERRSLLARLLSGDWEPNTYSAGAASIPIRQVATFPFIVSSMDVAVAPQDKIPRIAISDGQRVFVYRLKDLALEPEWTFDKRMVGNIMSVQFADLNGDGVLDVVVNRQDYKAGMLSYILTTEGGRPKVLAEDIPLVLLAVDEKGEGVKRELWGQRPNDQTFFTKGSLTRYVLKGDDIAAAGRVFASDAFRPVGATFSNSGGKDSRVLAFVDEYNRLRITVNGQEMWRSSTSVGGGLTKAHIQIPMLQTVVDKFFNWEPNPVAIDLDGDGVQEIVVPVNEDDAGRMAVVFKGPAGFRIQTVASGFEGKITGLGAIPGDTVPSLVAAVVRRGGLLFKDQGETQLILTVAE